MYRASETGNFSARYLRVSGCSHRLYWLQITPEKQVLEGYDEDQSLRDYVAKLANGPAVKGQLLPTASFVLRFIGRHRGQERDTVRKDKMIGMEREATG